MVGHRRRRLSYISVTHRQLHVLQVLRVSTCLSFWPYNTIHWPAVITDKTPYLCTRCNVETCILGSL